MTEFNNIAIIARHLDEAMCNLVRIDRQHDCDRASAEAAYFEARALYVMEALVLSCWHKRFLPCGLDQSAAKSLIAASDGSHLEGRSGMRLASYRQAGIEGLAAADQNGTFHGHSAKHPAYPGSLSNLVAAGQSRLRDAGRLLLQSGAPIDLDAVELLPPLPCPPKILCVGLNYADHSAESGFKQPDYPTMFGRFASSLIGHGAPIIRPRVSEQLDFEGEFVAVIGQGGRDIPKERALDHVLAYSLFNDASIRDYQFKAPQWTMGKNFDGTGAFGPFLVTADELPPGCKGLRLQTRLNGEVVQDASTDDLVFDVATLVSLLSEALTLEPGDVIVTGTPSGVGLARKPPLWMKPGDVCEVELEALGVLRNPVADQVSPTA